jgi:hypothetical protein
MSPKIDSDLCDIEQLLVELGEESNTVPGLMREHLAAARFYLLGSMPEEYGLELTLAEELLSEISDERLRSHIAAFLKIQHRRSSTLRPAVSRHAEKA